MPSVPQALDLAVRHHEAGRWQEAEALYRQILAVQPEHPDALHLLGVIALDTGHHEQALALISRAVAVAPDQAAHYGNLGEAFRRAGRFDEAVASLRRALALQPQFPNAENNLGSALAQQGRPADAIACFQRAVAIDPAHAKAWGNLARTLAKLGRWPEAEEAYRRLVMLQSENADVHYQLGHALLVTSQYEESAECFRRAAELRPDFIEAINNLGLALTALGRIEEALAAFEEALRQRPESAATCNNIATAMREAGRLDEAIAIDRRALELDPASAGIHSNLLYGLHFSPGQDERAVAAEHRRWHEVHALPLAKFIRPHPRDRAPDRRLRIGYLSPDFRQHPVAAFLEGLLASHDPAQFEVHCYADIACEDAVTGRLKKHAAHWRRIHGMPDEQVDRLIRDDGIDILVDLAGHTSGNRLLIFARKPAPVQVAWLGYCDTTGMKAMDYRFTDGHADPPGATERLHSEQLIRLPETAWCFQAPLDSPGVEPWPVRDDGQVTFGCFNARPKMNDEVLALWARLLLQVPGSRILLKNGGLHDAGARQRVHDVFRRAGVDIARVELIGWLPTPADHLAAHGRVHIALDTFPYHGTTTTCEALWMGLPVVTLAGRTHAARVGVSLLHAVGMQELTADTPDGYVSIAAALAADLPRLAGLRATLRTRMQKSPLMDAPPFARHIEAAFREMWAQWCAGHQE